MRTSCWWSIAAVALLVLIVPGQLQAGGRADQFLYGPARKLGRGVTNILTAPLEFFREPALVSERDGRLAGATIGIARGAVSAVVRGVGGVIEVLTFFCPFPNHFQPIVRPEFVYANGDWQP